MFFVGAFISGTSYCIAYQFGCRYGFYEGVEFANKAEPKELRP